MKKKLLIKLVLVFIFFVPFLATRCPGKSLNERSFKMVWQTVNEKHYDPDFGGLDWKAIHGRYESQISVATSDTEFYTITNKMLFELNLSHLLVISHKNLERYLPNLFAGGEIGVDIRLLDDNAVITSIKPGSPGDHAGLRSGFIIQRINGISIGEIVAEAKEKLVPPFNSRNKLNNISLLILGYIYGKPNTDVSISYLDGQGKKCEKKMKRESRAGGQIFMDALPPSFIEFEAKQLKDNIGYISFNHFSSPIDLKFLAALETMSDTQGLIIDLRGNSGGFIKIADEIARHLLSEKTLFSILRFRNRVISNVLTPMQNIYKAPIVILIDVMSLSCSDYFASSLQVIKRAVIIGERSPGFFLVANWIKLPNGAAFMHTIAQPFTPDGKVIENVGVIPDIEVRLNRNLLLEGKDTQLQAAIEYIKREE